MGLVHPALPGVNKTEIKSMYLYGQHSASIVSMFILRTKETSGSVQCDVIILLNSISCRWSITTTTTITEHITDLNMRGEKIIIYCLSGMIEQNFTPSCYQIRPQAVQNTGKTQHKIITVNQRPSQHQQFCTYTITCAFSHKLASNKESN